MPANQTRTCIPDDARDYRVRAFFDDESDKDLPDLHVYVGKHSPIAGDRSMRTHTEVILVAPTEPDDCRIFWERIKAAAEAALARVEAVTVGAAK